jgi:hypothetical protein
VTGLLVALASVLQGPLDEGTLLVRDDTAEVAREAFRISSSRVGPGAAGWKLTATVRYDRSRPVIVLNPIVELGIDSLPLSLEFNVADPREPLRILGQLVRGRFVVRLLGQRTERAREFPAAPPPPVVLLDDSVFALYLPVAWHATAGGTSVTAIFPRVGRREVLTVQDLGVQPTTLNHDRASLRHVTVSGGLNQLVHVWLGPDGRLVKVEVPSRRFNAERAPAS